MPVTEAKARWGDRIALFGGVDVDFLARSTPAVVGEYTRCILSEKPALPGSVMPPAAAT